MIKNIFAVLICMLLFSCNNVNALNNNLSSNNSQLYFDSKKAYDYVKAQTDLGPRVYGSEAHKKVREYFKKEISNMGYEVFSHKFEAPYIKGREGENIYAFLNGKTDKYIIIASHYDSRSVAEKDPVAENRNKPIDGANDGASSSGVLLELMNALKNYELDYSICFVLFDLEDDGNLFGVEGTSPIETDWIQGSIAFVNDNVVDKNKIKFGILLDMVGSGEALFKYENFAYTYYSDIYKNVWSNARYLSYEKFFVNDFYGGIIDDHTPFIFNNIPFIDVIDMSYKYHHTQNDTIDKIDINTLEAVGKTIEYTIVNTIK